MKTAIAKDQQAVDKDWAELKTRIKAKFEKLSDESIASMKGNLDLLSSKLQAAYGYAREHADKEFQTFKALLTDFVEPTKPVLTPLESKESPKSPIGKYIAAALLLVSVGCSSGPKVKEFADTANSTEELQLLATDMHNAVSRQVDALSPSSFHEADESLKEAVAAEKKGKDAKEVLHLVAVGRSYLNRANQFADLSRTNLEAVVAARQAALTAGALESFRDDFSKADSHLQSVTSQIEENNLSEVAENRDKLQAEYLAVELKAIQKTNLAPAREVIATAEKEGAKEYAPQSLAIALKKVSDSDAFIVANRHQTDAVKARSEEAMNAANHLLKITRASKAGKSVSSEETALRMESEKDKTQAGAQELNVQRETAKNLATVTAGLRSDQAFNARFELARSEFTTREAEVYRKGNQLVIRLRSLEFPTNQSMLRADNFPLLAKVAKVVKGFENSSVLIEGHTDSDGGQAANQKLSKERAHAISEYLISNQAVEPGSIADVGYGFDRPLASNKTAKGKAQNRRVDIVISPKVVTE